MNPSGYDMGMMMVGRSVSSDQASRDSVEVQVPSS